MLRNVSQPGTRLPDLRGRRLRLQGLSRRSCVRPSFARKPGAFPRFSSVPEQQVLGFNSCPHRRQISGVRRRYVGATRLAISRWDEQSRSSATLSALEPISGGALQRREALEVAIHGRMVITAAELSIIVLTATPQVLEVLGSDGSCHKYNTATKRNMPRGCR